jgi:hypothetical protein
MGLSRAFIDTSEDNIYHIDKLKKIYLAPPADTFAESHKTLCVFRHSEDFFRFVVVIE